MLAASTSSSDLDSAATYAQNRITIDYVTSDGTHLLDPLTIFGPVGQSFKIATPGFDHYVLREIPAIANQPMPDTEDPHIELVYDRLGAIQIFHDADTSPFQTIDLHPSSNDAQKVQPVRLEPILGKAYFIREQNQPAQFIAEPQKFVPADPTRMTQIWLTSAKATAKASSSAGSNAETRSSVGSNASAEANASTETNATASTETSSSATAVAQKAQEQNLNAQTVAAEQPHATMTTPLADAMIKQSLSASTSTSAFKDQQVSQPVAAQPATQTPTQPIKQTVSEVPEQTITPLFATDFDAAPQQKLQPVADETATANGYEAPKPQALAQPAPAKIPANAAVTADDDQPLMILSHQLTALVNALNLALPAQRSELIAACRDYLRVIEVIGGKPNEY